MSRPACAGTCAYEGGGEGGDGGKGGRGHVSPRSACMLVTYGYSSVSAQALLYPCKTAARTQADMYRQAGRYHCM